MSVLLQETFDAYTPATPPPAPWMVLFGIWLVEDGILSQNDEAVHAHIRTGSILWKDYVVEADVQLVSGIVGGGAGVIARAKRVGVKEVGYALVLYRTILKLYDVDGWIPLATVAVNIQPLEWHRLKLGVDGSSIKGWLDNELLIQATDEKYTEGQIDLFTSSQHSHFDNILVSAIAPLEVTLPMIGGIAVAVVDVALILYYIATHISSVRE